MQQEREAFESPTTWVGYVVLAKTFRELWLEICVKFIWFRCKSLVSRMRVHGTDQSCHILISFEGKYLFVESSSPAALGNRARLVSWLLSENLKCMTFWYHMLGDGIGDLIVYSKKAGSVEKMIWKLSGDQGYEWGQASVKLNIDSEHQVSCLPS